MIILRILTWGLGWTKLSLDCEGLLSRLHSAPQVQFPATRSMTTNIARSNLPVNRKLPENVGKHSKRIDKALPGKHTKKLYNQFNRREAAVLVQLRTRMVRLNGYLYRIRATDSEQCPCGQACETIDHFLFTCTRWVAQRKILLQAASSRMGNLAYFLGGKTARDGKDWMPDMQALKATIKFAMATGQLEVN